MRYPKKLVGRRPVAGLRGRVVAFTQVERENGADGKTAAPYPEEEPEGRTLAPRHGSTSCPLPPRRRWQTAGKLPAVCRVLCDW